MAGRWQRQHKVWEIVGGQDTGGIVVRAGPELSSPKAEQRLSTGSRVLEIGAVSDAAAGQRLHFQRLSGFGPEEGWVSVSLNHKPLARRVEFPAVGSTARPRCVDPSMDISGRWTMVSSWGSVNWFLISHKPGGNTFSGRHLDSCAEITDGRISDLTVEWRIQDFHIKGQLTGDGKRMEHVKVVHVESGTPCGVFTGTWDPGKEKFLVDNTLLQSQSPGLEYRKSPRLEDLDPSCSAAWGTIVVGIDEGIGWVKVVDRYLPKEVDGQAVLRDPNAPAPQRPRKPATAAKGAAARAAARQPFSAKPGRDLLAPPEHLLGCPVPGVPRLTRSQAVHLQRELARGYAAPSFQEQLHAAWRAEAGSPAEQQEAVRKLCARVHVAALAALTPPEEGDEGEARGAAEHMAGGDAELGCNALLLKWLLEPDLQAHVSTVEEQAPKAEGSKGYEVFVTDPGDEGAIHGIGKSRGAFARAHQDLYKAYYGAMLHNEWLGVLGNASTEAYLEQGMIMMHAECLATGDVVGYIACRCGESSADISHIAVLPTHQGRGVGRMLFERLVQHLASVAPEACSTLFINVVELNTRAVAWYRRLGFVVSSLWTRHFVVKSHRVPVVLLTMRRDEGASPGASALFGRDICGAKVAVFPPEAPPAFLEAVAQRRWPFLSVVTVAGFESDTGEHQLQDGRRLNVSLAFSHGRAFFDRPLHAILPK